MKLVNKIIVYYTRPRGKLQSIIGLLIVKSYLGMIRGDLEKLRTRVSEREKVEMRLALLESVLKNGVGL